MSARRLAAGVAVALAAVGALVAAGRDDAEAAERQYRVARRLAADGSPDAAAALERVVELDPTGALADDALVDEALLLPIARWPEELGRVDPAGARVALALLERSLTVPRGDRGSEARYLRALVRLEPLPGFDPAAARSDLVAVASALGPGATAVAARYAVGWLAEGEAAAERAFDAYQRIVIDAPSSAAAARARVGIARIELARGDPGAAARWLEEAVEHEPAGESTAVALRELALRRVLARAGAAPAAREGVAKIATRMRSVTDLAPLSTGGILLASVKDRTVVELDEWGSSRDLWQIEGLQAIAVDPGGRAWAASGDALWRLSPGGEARRVAATGDYGPVQAIAVDALGGIFLLDRRGERIGRVEPGAAAPAGYREDRAWRLVDLAWDGAQLVALDARARAVLAFGADGTIHPLALPELSRPLALAADPAGRIGVLDPRAGVVASVFVPRHAGSGGAIVTDTFDLAAVGVARPVAFAFALDGALELFDATDGGWFREP